MLIPLILIYTGYAYWVFRGKMDPRGGLSLMPPIELRGTDDRGPASPVPRPEWGKRLLWFVGLWLLGVASVAAIGLLIKLLLQR